MYILALNKNEKVASARFWQHSEWHLAWHWRRPLFCWEDEHFIQLNLLLASIELKEDVGDKWIWRLDPTGVYLVKSAYIIIMATLNVSEDDAFKRNMGKMDPIEGTFPYVEART